ncbi:hypothetical protein ZIOFF_060238 [Zingiber officinale]|uniref:NAD-dependent epimerase/dehydratase domain-containing protein n=1 Tax=Zingiber officinale TaxID=94328 RepID=A0A8J5FGE8_ZINOF|nr:hypothetical protein ZIOFF_060238 [Zingiber officinale]
MNPNLWLWVGTLFVLFQVLVLGGHGFIGLHVCKEALDQGLSVSSLSRIDALLLPRSGRSSIREQWVDKVEWCQGSLLEIPVTFVVVQKCNHTRLFANNHGDHRFVDKSGNTTDLLIRVETYCLDDNVMEGDLQ